VQSDQTLCTGSTDESVSVMDDCGFIRRMGRGLSFATSFSLVIRHAQYPIQLTYNVPLPGNKAIEKEAKNPKSSTGCIFCQVSEHRGYNGHMQTIYAIKLPCTMTRQKGPSLVPSLYMRGVNKT